MKPSLRSAAWILCVGGIAFTWGSYTHHMHQPSPDAPRFERSEWLVFGIDAWLARENGTWIVSPLWLGIGIALTACFVLALVAAERRARSVAA